MTQIIEKRQIPFAISGALFLLSLVALGVFGLTPGIDFTGGSLIETRFTEVRPSNEEIVAVIDSLNIGQAVVQQAGDEAVLIKLRFLNEDEHQAVLTGLRESFETDSNKVIEDRIDTIGPAVSSQLRRTAVTAGVAVILAIVLYVAYAFRKVSQPVNSWKYGVAAIVALVHDVTITMGAFAVLGHYYGVEVDIAFVVALLTILGYSVNDTIVVFDRIRENLLQDGPRKFAETVNNGVNQTLFRSLNTSATTLLVLGVLFVIGGSAIQHFALTLIIGIVLGTYSSIFLASPLIVTWYEWEQDRKGKKR